VSWCPGGDAVFAFLVIRSGAAGKGRLGYTAATMNTGTSNALNALNTWLARQPGVAVAYSGGMDSAFLAIASKRILGPNTRAFLVVSEVMPRHEVESARAAAMKHGLDLVEVPLEVLPLEAFSKHPPDRCYLCKKHVFGTLLGLKPEGWLLADGSNIDDRGDHRPGRRALTELGVVSPLEIAGFSKQEIRKALTAWNATDLIRPPGPCLATRIPFCTPVTEPMLRQIEEGEALLREAGFSDARVRHHGSYARLEVPAPEIARLETVLPGLLGRFKALGFTRVEIAPEGYRRGAMNEVPSTAG